MVRMFVRHTVADFGSWKQGYDEFAGQRGEMGVRGDAVFCGVDNANDVTVWHDFEDVGSAEAFLASPVLESVMKEAGVTSEPLVWFVDRDLPA
jgi:hypothetical protein